MSAGRGHETNRVIFEGQWVVFLDFLLLYLSLGCNAQALLHINSLTSDPFNFLVLFFFYFHLPFPL